MSIFDPSFSPDWMWFWHLLLMDGNVKTDVINAFLLVQSPVRYLMRSITRARTTLTVLFCDIFRTCYRPMWLSIYLSEVVPVSSIKPDKTPGELLQSLTLFLDQHAPVVSLMGLFNWDHHWCHSQFLSCSTGTSVLFFFPDQFSTRTDTFAFCWKHLANTYWKSGRNLCSVDKTIWFGVFQEFFAQAHVAQETSYTFRSWGNTLLSLIVCTVHETCWKSGALSILIGLGLYCSPRCMSAFVGSNSECLTQIVQDGLGKRVDPYAIVSAMNSAQFGLTAL